MAASTCWSLILAFLCACLSDVGAEEYCNITNVIEVCEWGCCGDYPDTECCHWALKFIHLLVWGGLLGLALVISLIMGVVLLFKKQTVVEGHVLHPPGHASAAAFSAEAVGTNNYWNPRTGPWIAGPGVPNPSVAALPPPYSSGPADLSPGASGSKDAGRGV